VPVRSTLAATAVAVAAVAAAFIFGTNLTHLVHTPRLYGQTWDVSVDAEFDQIPHADLEAFLRQQPGVSGWTFGNHDEATVEGRPIAAIKLQGAQGSAAFPALLEGRAPNTGDEIVLGTTTLKDTHRRIGQTVNVALQGNDTPRTMTIVGRAVFPFFGQGEVTPTGLGNGAALFDTEPNPDASNFVLVKVTHGASTHDNVTRLTDDLNASGLCPQGCHAITEQRPADVTNYARVTTTPLALAGVLTLLAIATVTHLLVTSIRYRRRDFATLKALGFLQHQVSAAVAWQATIVTTLALLVGVPVGIITGRWAWQFFASRLGAASNPQLPIIATLLAIPAALAIANALAALPARHAARTSPAEVLRTE
jgi:putative ABC transport system permease protein